MIENLPFWIKLALFVSFAFIGGRVTLRERPPLIKNQVIFLSLTILLSKAGMYLVNYEPPAEFSYLLAPALGVVSALFVLTYLESLRDEMTKTSGA